MYAVNLCVNIFEEEQQCLLFTLIFPLIILIIVVKFQHHFKSNYCYDKIGHK